MGRSRLVYLAEDAPDLECPSCGEGDDLVFHGSLPMKIAGGRLQIDTGAEAFYDGDSLVICQNEECDHEGPMREFEE